MCKAIDLINDSEWESDGTQSTITFSNVEKLMIEFAKLHVEAALKIASEIADGIDEDGYYVPNSSIDKQLILHAYPLTNIK